MSEAATQSAATSRAGSSSSQAAPAARPGGAAPARKGLAPALVAAAGGIVTGALLVGALSLAPSGQPAALSLQAVASRDIDEAALSLDPTTGRAAADEARQCKAPLAFVTMSVAPGQPPASIRIRSGSYLSPSIRITDAPRRIAVPFPAPYPTGSGALSIEGSARNLNVWLNPGRHIETLNGAHMVPVVWTPKNPC